VTLSATNPLATSCGPAAVAPDAVTVNSAVQPQVAISAIPGGINTPTGTAALGVAVWEQDRWKGMGARAIVAAITSNGGNTWGTPFPLPFSTCGGNPGSGLDRSSDPAVAIGPAAGSGSVVYASALAFSAGNYLVSGGQSAVLVARSLDNGQTWSAPVAVIADTGNASAAYFNDRDALAADPSGSFVYLVWDRISSQFSAGGSASIPTYLSRSTDQGSTWSPAAVVYDPGPALQTFNNLPVVLPDGSVGISFTLTDGFTDTLQFIRSVNHGLTWPATGTAITVATMTPLPVANPTGSQLLVRDSPAMAQLAVDPVNGTLALVWEESVFAGVAQPVNGIALSLSTDKGNTWSTPVRVNTVAGVAAFDPAVHFGSNGQLAISYDDFRDDIAGNPILATGAWLKTSADGGRTWSESRLAGPFDLNRAPLTDGSAGSIGNALFLGDQQGLGWNGQAWLTVQATTNATTSQITARTMP
jgi:hypothetical protein